MQPNSCFLSVVLVLKDQSSHIPSILAETEKVIAPLVHDYELIVIDNASCDESVSLLKELTSESGMANLQVYALAKAVDTDTASWVGVENALGDFVAVINPMLDSLELLPKMLDAAISGNDVVFAANTHKEKHGVLYNLCFSVFNFVYMWASGLNLAKEAPHFRLLSRRVVNYILQHPSPSACYKYLPATGGFAKKTFTYEFSPIFSEKKNLVEAATRGIRLLVSTTRGPMRIVTILCLFGAISNLVYSFYVIGIAAFKKDVAPGWVTLSLQQSGMFFLISLVLLVLAEYILNMARLTNEGPAYYIGQEFTSAIIKRRERLNIEVSPIRPDSNR